MARSKEFLMTRFMAPILIRPANYDTAMLAFSKLVPCNEKRDGKTEEERRQGYGTLCVSVIPACRSAGGSDELGALLSPWHLATVCPLGVLVTKMSH